MPLSQINPNGTVKITNSITGEVKDVKPEELASYSPKLVAEYQTKLQGQQSISSAADSVKAGTLPAPTGNSATDIQLAQALREQGYTAENAKAKKAQDASNEAKKVIATTAQGVLDVLNSRDSFKTEQEYRDALNYAVSDYNKRAFTEAGKSVVGREQGLIQGTQIVTNTLNPNLMQRIEGSLSGRQYGPKTEVADPDQTIKDKMAMAIKAAGGKIEEAKKTEKKKEARSNEKGTLQRVIEGAGGDIEGIIKGLAGAGQQYAGFGLTNPAAMSDMASKTLPAIGQEALDLTGGKIDDNGVSFSGQRALDHAIDHPVNTAMDVLPVVGGAKVALLGKGAEGAEAARATTLPEITTTSSPVADALVKGSELLGGGGSKEYIARNAVKPDAIPQRQVLMDEGILSRPTDTGRIQATSQAIDKYGKQLEDTYKKSDRIFRGEELGKTLDDQLSELGYEQDDINFMKKHINKKGDFDLASGDTILLPERVWVAARNLEKGAPKFKNAESTALFKQMTNDTARILRQQLADKVRETVPLNQRYSALKDYMDEVLQDPKGVSVKGGIVNTIINSGKNAVADPLLNKLYSQLPPIQ